MTTEKLSERFVQLKYCYILLILVFLLSSCREEYSPISEKDIDYIEQEVMRKHHSHPNPKAEFIVNNIRTDYIELQADKDSDLEALVRCAIYPTGHTEYGESSSMNYRLFLIDYNGKWIIKDSIFGRASDLRNDFRVVDMNGDNINEILLYTFHNAGGSGSVEKTLIYDLASNRFKNLFHKGAFHGDIIYEETKKTIYRIQAYPELEDGGTYSPHRYTVEIFRYNNGQFLAEVKLTTTRKYCLADCENLYTSTKVLDELGLKR